jgi:cation transport protein ChaC
VRWIEVESGGATHEALAFWADTTHTDFNVSLPLPEVARILARACGHIGSGAEYLFHTVSKLEEFGIRDGDLWQLQEMVAAEIKLLIAEETARAAP